MVVETLSLDTINANSPYEVKLADESPFSIIYQSGYLIICCIYLCTVCMVCF